MKNFKLAVLIISPNIEKYKSVDYNVFCRIYNKRKQDIEPIFKNSISSYEELLTILNENKTVDAIVIDHNTDSLTIDILKNSSTEIQSIVSYTHELTNEYLQYTLVPEIYKEKYNNSILFSFYTCTFNTNIEKFYRLYKSIQNQTYTHWNWYILDDSTNDIICEYIKTLNDPRIIVYKNITNHANIGFNKHSIAMLCSGDWLLEVDHDDILTSDCLETVYYAIQKFPKSKFIYSDALEEYSSNIEEKQYGKEYTFSWCLGYYKDEIINNQKRIVATCGPLNPITVRTILCAPNHIRCIKKEFYYQLNGHNTRLSVMDDLDLIHRMFIHCDSIENITYINKCLYIQDLKDDHTTQNNKGMILLSDEQIFKRDDKAIHDKLVELNLPDPMWNDKVEETCINQQYIRRNKHLLPILCNIYNPNE